VVDEIDDGRTAVRVACGRDDARRLVQEHVGEPLRRKRKAVELDDVPGLDERVQLPRLAVHGHAACLDQLVGAATGGGSGPGEVCVEPHGVIIRCIDAWLSPDGSETARYARLRRRALAGVIDATACIALYLLVSIPAGMVQIVGTTIVADGTLRGAVGLLSQLLVAAAVVAYLTLGLRSGQTLGMRAIDVHVRVDGTGRVPGLGRAAGRGVLGLVFALAILDADVALRGRPPLGGFSELEQTVLDLAVVVAAAAILGKLWAFVDPARRSVWDRLFGLAFLEDLDARGTAEVDYGTWLRRRARAPS
jgi:uncharacterized RDD family membrane protein YckC